MRRYIALAVAGLAVASAIAPSAQADSIVYERGGNVWLANPDGTGARQVTTSGGYDNPSQADDGTIIAAKDDVLHRLSRSGAVLNAAGDDDYGKKIFTDTSPDGALASYGFFANGPILEGPYTGVSHASRPTEKEEIDGPLKGYFNSRWLDSRRLLLFPQSLTVDVQIWPIPGNVQDWFIDNDYDLTGGEVDRAMTKLVATAGGATILLYRLPAPPPALPERRCQITGASGTFFRPTWSPDGQTFAFEAADGIHTVRVDLNVCENMRSELVIPGGTHPDWGPAAPGAALTAKAPRRIRLAALLRGLTVRVTCSCTARAKLLLKGRTVGKARKRLSGRGRIKVKPTRSGKARLLSGGKRVSVRVSGAGRTVTRKVRIVR